VNGVRVSLVRKRRGRRGARSIAVCALLISLRASGAHAQPSRSPHVVLNLGGCDPALASEVRRIASVELRAVVVEPTQADGAVTHAVVTCREGGAELQVSDAATSKQLQRIVSLSDATPLARARLLALAIAELVAASWEELESNPEPKVAAVPPPTARMRALVRRNIERSPRIVADAVGEARLLAAGRVWLFGGGVRASVRLGDVVALRIDALADLGQALRSPGRVSLEVFGGAVALGWGVDWDWLYILPWTGVRGGYAHLLGVPALGSTGHLQAGPWLGPDVGLEFVIWPHGAVHATVGLSAGAALLGVRGQVEGGDNVDVLGAWSAIALGIGFSKR
jgi:hypothetical protein